MRGNFFKAWAHQSPLAYQYPKQRPAQAGFSVIEMVVVIVVVSIIAAIGSRMLSTGFQFYLSGRDVVRGDSQARLALERMTRELRAVRSATAADLIITPNTEITYTDIDGSVVRFYRNGNVLTRSNGGVLNAQPLAEGITALSFSYLRSDGITVETTTPSLVRHITVDFTVTRGTANTGMRTTVAPRNF